jgi:uncharacterized protein (DUF58 family)
MPSRHGWAAAALAACAFAIGRVFGLIELYVFGTGLLIALAIGLISVRLPFPALGVERVVRPDMVAVGQPARVDIEVSNLGRTTSPQLQLWESVGDHGGAPMQLAPLAPLTTATAAYQVPTTRRGRIELGPLRATRRDALALCQRTIVLTGVDELLVIPRYVVLPFPDAGSAGRLGQHLRMAAWGQTGSEFHSLREYVPGDELRRINWKASARSTELLVRESDIEGVRRCTVLLDTYAGQLDQIGFERAVSAAASLVNSAAASGIATRMVAAGTDLRGPDVGISALRWLATATRADTPLDTTTVSKGAGEGIGLMIVVTGSSTSPLVQESRAVMAPDDVQIVVCSQTRPTSGRFAVDATSLEHLTDEWSVLVQGTRSGRR